MPKQLSVGLYSIEMMSVLQPHRWHCKQCSKLRDEKTRIRIRFPSNFLGVLLKIGCWSRRFTVGREIVACLQFMGRPIPFPFSFQKQNGIWKEQIPGICHKYLAKRKWKWNWTPNELEAAALSIPTSRETRRRRRSRELFARSRRAYFYPLCLFVCLSVCRSVGQAADTDGRLTPHTKLDSFREKRNA